MSWSARACASEGRGGAAARKGAPSERAHRPRPSHACRAPRRATRPPPFPNTPRRAAVAPSPTRHGAGGVGAGVQPKNKPCALAHSPLAWRSQLRFACDSPPPATPSCARPPCPRRQLPGAGTGAAPRRPRSAPTPPRPPPLRCAPPRPAPARGAPAAPPPTRGKRTATSRETRAGEHSSGASAC